MKIAMISSAAWRTPTWHYGPWEKFVSLLTEELVARGFDITLFPTKDSITKAKLEAVVERGYEEDKAIEVKVAEYLHLSNLMEKANEFDLVHNNFDFPALAYSDLIKTPILTTIHGFSLEKTLSFLKKYNKRTFYVAISHASKNPELDYLATIYPGIDLKEFFFKEKPGDYLLFLGQICQEKGTWEAIQVAKMTGMKLILTGIIQDRDYFQKKVAPELDGDKIKYVGSPDLPEKAELLSTAYALLYLINFEEPFGLSVIEALASGTPVIAFNRGAIPEIMVDGRTGFIVDELEVAAEKVKAIKEINRIDCRRHVEARFTKEKMVDEYIEVYKKVVEGTLGKGQKGLRPWGRYIVLEEGENHKVKRIEVKEGTRLSYQRHKRRNEHWFILEGKALVTIDGQETLLTPGESINIPALSLHRIEAKEGNVVFIEVQRGSYLGEDDVERVEDDFGRL